MLTIAFVTSALALLASASPAADPVYGRGLRIPLSKRSALSLDGVVDPAALVADLERTIFKFGNGFAAYEKNTGHPHPLADLFHLPNFPSDDSGSDDSDSDGSHDGLNQRDADSTVPDDAAAKPSPTPTPAKGTGSVPLTDENNGELWQGTLNIGTPPKPFTVQFDTGSSDLFVPGPNCTGADGHARFNPANSSTAVPYNKTSTLNYGSGPVVVNQYMDTVSIVGLTAAKQRLGVATSYSKNFGKASFPPDGLMGMAYQQISVYNAPPVFQSLVAAKQVTTPVFSFKLATSGSELFLGGTDASKFTGKFTYLPVTTPGYWQVALDTVTVNGKTALTKLQSIIDTGTTLIAVPSAQARTFYASIPGSTDASSSVGPGFFTFPCSTTQRVSLGFGGTNFTIAPNLFNLGQTSAGSKNCIGAVVGSSSIGFWVVGDTFLQNVYSTFDLQNNRVGFATLK